MPRTRRDESDAARRADDGAPEGSEWFEVCFIARQRVNMSGKWARTDSTARRRDACDAIRPNAGRRAFIFGRASARALSRTARFARCAFGRRSLRPENRRMPSGARRRGSPRVNWGASGAVRVELMAAYRNGVPCESAAAHRRRREHESKTVRRSRRRFVSKAARWDDRLDPKRDSKRDSSLRDRR